MTKRASPRAVPLGIYKCVPIIGPTPEDTAAMLDEWYAKGYDVIGFTSAVAGFSVEGHDENGNHVHTVYQPLAAMVYFKRRVTHQI